MLSKQHRLQKEKDIKTLFSRGKGVFDDVCGVKYRKNDLGVTRVAVIVGKKVSKKAVDRNRLRRQVREIVRAHFSQIKPGFDIAFFLQKNAMGAPYDALEDRVVRVLKKATLFKR